MKIVLTLAVSAALLTGCGTQSPSLLTARTNQVAAALEATPPKS